MLHVLIGEDDFSIRETLEEIKGGIGDATALLTNTTTLDGRQVSIEKLKNASETVPFLADKRLVIVEGLLSRFEANSRAGRRKKKKADNGEEWSAFAEVAKGIPEFTEMVIIDGKTSGRNPLLNELTKTARVRTFPLMREAQLRQWISQRVEKAGSSLTPGAMNALVRFVGNDLWLMSNEITKLALFTSGRRIEVEDIKTVVSSAQETNVFAMVDAILDFKVGVAEQLLEDLLQRGASPAYLLVMLSRQVQLLVRVKGLRSQKKSRSEIQNKLGLTSDFVLRKALEQADKYSLARLKEVYHKLLEADLSMKTGKYDGELAFNILIAELGQ